ncbi:hypothetical protein B0H17DRAFT_1147869 [Mycena rosella]|uniref:Bacteriophage T5 Orf172 DNA-binding domain-containing protein n=1 Tax=Mycena rosella TaxID=1033263 RepID=A0AAD7G1H8_MYCRO|nr:hypothetical protein B0H17DRAFT_1147869 [Mycena rosella]
MIQGAQYFDGHIKNSMGIFGVHFGDPRFLLGIPLPAESTAPDAYNFRMGDFRCQTSHGPEKPSCGTPPISGACGRPRGASLLTSNHEHPTKVYFGCCPLLTSNHQHATEVSLWLPFDPALILYCLPRSPRPGILDAAVARILTSNPALWRPGAFYAFRILDTQPPPSTITKPSAVKMGRSNKPPRRKSEWRWKCWPQQHKWWFYFDVPDAASFEHLIHLHFRLHGAWIQPEECEFCGVKHCEKFDEALCGGKAGVIAVVRFYLVHLGWPVTMYNM